MCINAVAVRTLCVLLIPFLNFLSQQLVSHLTSRKTRLFLSTTMPYPETATGFVVKDPKKYVTSSRSPAHLLT
jgi:hypothetical protein